MRNVKWDNKVMWIPYVALALFYLGAIFPLCYFRHDDWLILGNALFKVASDPDFLWQPTLYYGDLEVIWFFRPFFKGAVLLFYHAFGLNYYLWLTALFGLLCATLWLTTLSLKRISSNPSRGFLFLVLFAAALPIHFGSAVWMGEGMMNIPQLFLLALSLYCFLVSLGKTLRAVPLLLSVLLYVLALGFKEAGVFHFGLLVALLFGEAGFRRYRASEKVVLLTPFALVTAFYLAFRFSLPVHPSYLPLLKWYFFTDPLARLLAVPLLCLALVQGLRIARVNPGRRKGILYCGLFFATLLPYLAHGFFSVGWLLLPTYYFFLLSALAVRDLQWNGARAWRLAVGLGTITAIPLVLFLSRVGWTQWEAPQRQIQAILEKAPSGTFKRLVVFECINPRYPSADLNRVVGFEASLDFLWRLSHPDKISVLVAHCGENEGNLQSYLAKNIPNELVLKWKFPKFEVLRPTEKPWVATLP